MQEDDRGRVVVVVVKGGGAEMSWDKSRGSAALSSRAVMRQRGESPAPRRWITKGETGMGGRGGRGETGREGGGTKRLRRPSVCHTDHQPRAPSIFQLLSPGASSQT